MPLCQANMAAISKQEYLKRYLSNPDDGKKKKRKKKLSKAASKFPTSIIVDDDLTLKDIAACDVTQEANEIEVDGEDAPAVYEDDGVTKISLETFKRREEDSKTKWAPINLSESSSAGGERERNSNRDREDLRDPMENNGRRQNTPDLSLQRNRFYDSPDESPLRKRHVSSSLVRPISKFSSPQVGEREVTQLDNSPPRSRRKRHDSGDSPPQQTRDISPDQSATRKRRLDEPDGSSGRRCRNDSPDLSPPRQRTSPPRKGVQSDSDQSPPRKRGHSDSDQSPPRKRGHSDSDQSPPRKRVHSDSDQSPPRKHNRSPNRGRKAGLLSATDLQKENERRRDREADFFSKMDPSVFGKDSETVYRDKLGRKRDLKMERLKKREQERKDTEENEKFMEWGRGVTQTKQIKEKVADDLHEMEKPLARYRDDKDLDSMLKAQEREDDPMLAYMKQRSVKQNIKEGKKDKPVYKGPDPPPNRFNIRPGYRWDGVDRSNGFEKKRFAMLANKMATQAQAYKWSTEDM